MKSSIACPHCGEANPPGTLYCSKCKTAFPGADDASTIAPAAGKPKVTGKLPTFGGTSKGDSSFDDMPTMSGGTPLPPMERGTLLANGRYEIMALLGQGAMGAVYKAKDNELDRLVAIKVIQPELVNSPAILKRFKQELILARQVTHRNVVRIFDIGETDGMKFITMEYVDGGDLKSVILETGKMPAVEAVGIIRQICYALDAAHAEGVVHRDLKPQNIMMDQTGRVVVMDFGIAHSKEMPGMTMTGALMGTPEYMSPEQAKGEKTDLRADIFAVGIIFYEMLIGKVPFKSNTVVETMYKRTQERAIPPVDVDASIPVQANHIVMRCLETDPANRYQNVRELLQDLEVFDPEKKIGTIDRVRRNVVRKSKILGIAAAVAAIALLALTAGYFLKDRFVAKPETTTAHAPVTVLVSDFSNHTGDQIFDGTLEPVIRLALEGAGFISVFDRTQMRNLGLPAVSKLDEGAARQIAVSQGLGVVMSGSLDRKGTGYTLSIRATQAVTGNTISVAEDQAANKDQVVFTTTKLATILRKALGDDTSDSAQRFAMETLSATSLEAIHEYSTAMDGLSNAKYEDALKNFSKAIDIDGNFGLAYAGMAVASRSLGQQQDADKYIKLAISHLDRMTERERFRTRGSFYALNSDQHKCIDEYTALIVKFPADAAAHNNLAFCWADLGNMAKAVEEEKQAVAILPKRAGYRSSLAIYASFASDFQTGEAEARKSQELDPMSRFGYIGLAFAQTGLSQLAQAAETYRNLDKTGKIGASDAKSGLADLALYEGRFGEAASILEKGIAEDLASKYPDRAAEKLSALAYTRLMQGRKADAISAAQKALAASRIPKIRFLSGRIFAEAGQTADAQKLSADLAKENQAAYQAYAQLIDGELALAAKDPRKAIASFMAAKNLTDTWIGRFELGRAYLEAGSFVEADSEFEQCIKRRGEALALFDQAPTYGYLPPVHYYIGRVREGLKTGSFADSYKTYLSIRGKAGEDPLLSEVRKRAGL